MDRELTILIVDDNVQDTLMMKKALVKAGVTNPVQTAESGDAAIAYLQGLGKYQDRSQFPFPSLVFLDLKMPRADGFDVLRWLEAHPAYAVVPIIVMTHSPMDSDVRLAYQLGAHSYMVKPQMFDDLVELVRITDQYWAKCEKPGVEGSC